MMDWIIGNWYLIVAAVTMIFLCIKGAVWFVKLPSATKVQNLKEWLKYAVVEAEKELGSGTGQLKLRLVYNMAVDKFKWIPDVVSFETFSQWVDESLVWMKEQLESNKNVKALVE